MGSSSPIGIFDSGIGGLTIARSISRLLPHEDIIFFGDTAHLPYGDKSSGAIRHYSEEITKKLLSLNCKLIVIACNTASANAYSFLEKKFGKRVPIVNVIDPIVDHCVNVHHVKKIGVIGTKGTIRSRAYPRKFHKHNKKIRVSSVATPLLAPMIEEGFFNNRISQTIINAYLSRPNLEKIDALVLACTHYPLIKKEVEKFYHRKVDVIDSTDVVANNVKDILSQKELLNKDTQRTRDHQFFVSDYTESFQKTTEIFFGTKIKLKPWDIWS